MGGIKENSLAMGKIQTRPLGFKIPPKIRISGRVSYQVVFQDEIRGNPNLMGLAEPNERMIYIKIGMSERDTFKTLLHEVIHAIEFESETPIPERITETLEEGIFKVLKLNKIL